MPAFGWPSCGMKYTEDLEVSDWQELLTASSMAVPPSAAPEDVSFDNPPIYDSMIWVSSRVNGHSITTIIA